MRKRYWYVLVLLTGLLLLLQVYYFRGLHLRLYVQNHPTEAQFDRAYLRNGNPTTPSDVSMTTAISSSTITATPTTRRASNSTTSENTRTEHTHHIQYIYIWGSTIEHGTELFGSTIFRHTTNMHQRGAYWIVPARSTLKLSRMVRESIDRRIRRATRNTTGTNLDGQQPALTKDDVLQGWKVFVVDRSDWPAPRFLQSYLSDVVKFLGWQRLYLITRSTTVGRSYHRAQAYESWNATIPPRLLGRPYNFTSWIGLYCSGIKHFHFAVRDDVYRAINEELVLVGQRSLSITNRTDNNRMGGGAFIPNAVTLDRRYDVAHFWDPGDRLAEAMMRSAVSEAIVRLGAGSMSSISATTAAEPHNVSVLANIVGWRATKGRNFVHEDYIKALLEYKIVVVCQRDRFEDHFRLFEALISGAMVMTDDMIDFPAGIRDNRTIVVYRGIQDMQQKILYYLEHKPERLKIAQAGRSTALFRHREWHRWEDLILGDWTDVNEYGLARLNPGKDYKLGKLPTTL